MLADGLAGQFHQPFCHGQGQHLPVGERRDHFGRVAEPVDRHTHGGFRQIGIVVGGQGPHRGLAAIGGERRSEIPRHSGTGRDRHLPHGRAGADDLDQIVVGEHGREADDRQGDTVDVGSQTPGHIVRN